MIKSEKELLDYIASYGPLDAIVVEGYDGVGKGRVLNVLANYYQVVPYRPDYNFWQRYDHRKIDRWKISGFFWDVYSHFNQGRRNFSAPMLFDRGVISGAVYNKDDNIAKDYKKLLRDMRVLHILVTCYNKDDYFKLSNIRSVADVDVEYEWSRYQEYTQRYKRAFALAELEYWIYENHYDKSISDELSKTCEGCGHYSYGYCRHPDINDKTNPDHPRCKLSYDAEVQDRYVAEMHSV